MEILYDLLYDLLIISMVVKLLWDAGLPSVPRKLIIVGMVGVPFLLGRIWDRRGLIAVRIGMAVVTLILFSVHLPPHIRVIYLALLGISILVYLWSRLARRSSSFPFAALIVITIILYLVRIQ